MTSMQDFAGGEPQKLNPADTPSVPVEGGVLRPAKAPPKKEQPFDRPVILQQSPVWSRAIIWGIVGTAAALLTWAFVFQIDEAIPATGQLEPQGAVKNVQAPVAGVVKDFKVEDGDRVTAGDELLLLDTKGTKSEISALGSQLTKLRQVNRYYRQQLNGDSSAPLPDVVDSELVNATRDRQALVAENKLYRAQLNGAKDLKNFSAEERQRLQSGLAQGSTSMAAAKAQVGQGEKQLRQIEVQLEQTKIQLASAQETLALNKEIVKDIEDAYKKGAISRIQFKQQQDEVQTGAAEVARLQQEILRLGRQKEQVNQEKLQSEAQASNTEATNQREILDRIAVNTQRINDIDSNLTKAIVENQRTITDLENRKTQATLTQEYQVLKAPVSGVVFDLKSTTAGFVVNAGEPILKIVPDDQLKAKVYITNKDIGFVEPGMDVDVRIDSFNFSEFGDIDGEIESIGSDALPPTEVRQFYSFPAIVAFKEPIQTMNTNGRERPLQSGMSVSVNVKVRKRSVISLITDRFTREKDNIEKLR